MVDYSKWKDIEISDDEDDTHPNVDTPSLFRWRHQARVERMEALLKEKEAIKERKARNAHYMSLTRQRIAEAEPDEPRLVQLNNVLALFEATERNIQKREDELNEMEKKAPWNVDTISEPGFDKTVINTKAPEPQSQPKEEDLTEEGAEAKLNKFVIKNEKLMKKISMLYNYVDLRQLLMEHPHLVCEETCKYLILWCINLEMEEKYDQLAHVAHKTICMQYILDLTKKLKLDTRACVEAFFCRMQVAEKRYMEVFNDDVEQFKARIKKSNAERLQEKQEEAERAARLGPGGLDPFEVYEELPDELKNCFDAQDVPLLQTTIAKMPEQEAIYYMKRCVDSGLWVPSESDDDKDTLEDNNSSELSCEGASAASVPRSSTPDVE